MVVDVTTHAERGPDLQMMVRLVWTVSLGRTAQGAGAPVIFVCRGRTQLPGPRLVAGVWQVKSAGKMEQAAVNLASMANMRQVRAYLSAQTVGSVRLARVQRRAAA